MTEIDNISDKFKKIELGQFFTTYSEYILKDLNIPNNIKDVVEPFAGNKDLLKKFDLTSLNVKYYSKTFNTLKYKKENALSTQMAARELRYAWFEAISIDYDYVLTAHHLDDQLETFFINLYK